MANLYVNPAQCQAGDVIESDEYCHVVLGVDYRGVMPAQKEFFASAAVGPEDKKKMRAALRNFARSGPVRNRERYERFGDIHYLKIHGFRAYCFERGTTRGRELVVCHIVSKKTNKSLSDDCETRSRRVYHQHCEVYV